MHGMHVCVFRFLWTFTTLNSFYTFGLYHHQCTACRSSLSHGIWWLMQITRLKLQTLATRHKSVNLPVLCFERKFSPEVVVLRSSIIVRVCVVLLEGVYHQNLRSDLCTSDARLTYHFLLLLEQDIRTPIPCLPACHLDSSRDDNGLNLWTLSKAPH